MRSLARWLAGLRRALSVGTAGVGERAAHRSILQGMIWVAFFVFALASPWGWLSVIGPAGILYLLLRVTGIPLTEEQAVKSKGDAYRRYQATTSAFVPWFPKGEATP